MPRKHANWTEINCRYCFTVWIKVFIFQIHKPIEIFFQINLNYQWKNLTLLLQCVCVCLLAFLYLFFKYCLLIYHKTAQNTHGEFIWLSHLNELWTHVTRLTLRFNTLSLNFVISQKNKKKHIENMRKEKYIRSSEMMRSANDHMCAKQKYRYTYNACVKVDKLLVIVWSIEQRTGAAFLLKEI